MSGPDHEDVVARLRSAGCVWAEDEASLLGAATADCAQLEALVRRRVAGEPLETVLGWVAFLGSRLVVAPGVFVPRRRTELLARVTLGRVEHRRQSGTVRPVVVEMCCGVAPVAASLGPGVEVHVADLSDVALDCARANAPYATAHLGDLYDALPVALRGRVDVLVANAPYVPTGRIADMPPEARDHEPPAALDGGADGVDVHRNLASGAVDWLAPGGVLLVETSPSQAALTTSAMGAAGLAAGIEVDEEVGGCVAVGTGRVSRPGPVAVRA